MQEGGKKTECDHVMAMRSVIQLFSMPFYVALFICGASFITVKKNSTIMIFMWPSYFADHAFFALVVAIPTIFFTLLLFLD